MLHAIPHLEGLDRRLPAVRTTRPDFAQSYLGGIFADHRLVQNAGAINFVHQQTKLDATSIGLLRYGADVEVVAPALDFYLLQITLGGEIGIESSQFDLTLGPGSLFVMNPGVAYRKRWAREAQHLMIKIPRARLESRAGKEGGTPNFESRAYPLNGKMLPLLRLVDYLCRDLSDDNGLLGDPRMRCDLEHALLSGLLAAVPHTLPPLPMSGAIPHYLRRAEDHLHSNASRNVKMLELTEVAGVSERTLQDAFGKFRSKTPGEFARELRLDLVRQALTEQGDSVTVAALRFGFTHLGRFSRSYADRFGEYPSETLQRRQTH